MEVPRCRFESWAGAGRSGKVYKRREMMGYYSEMDIRLVEAGHRRGSKRYRRVARDMEAADCRVALGVRACAECSRRGDAGCVWSRYGLRTR